MSPGALPAADSAAAAEHGPYAGLATRAVALVVDAASVTVTFWLVTGLVALVLSLFSTTELHATLAVAGAIGSWAVFVAGYFTISWAVFGQTFGMHLMRVRVIDAHGKRPRLGRAYLRFVVFTLGAVPLFAGHLLVLVLPRRRALHDLVARTLVVYEGAQSRALAEATTAAPAADAVQPARPATS